MYGGDVWRLGVKESQKKKKTHLDSFCSGTIVLLLTLNPKTVVLVVLLAADQDFLADH